MTNGSVSNSENSIAVTGTINKVTDTAWMEKVWNKEEQTGYYIPMILSSEDGNVLRTTTLTGKDKDLTFGQTGDGAGRIVLILAVTNTGSKVKTCKVFAKDDTAFADPAEYTIDYSGCTFK